MTNITDGDALRAVSIDGSDVTTLVVYFAMVMGIGIGSMVGAKTDTEEGYFLAGRFMTWLPVGASLFATNIGSEHYVGLSGSGAQAGIAVGAFEFNALFMLPLLGWVFIPVYMASGVGTLPEYMTKRFGGQRIRLVISVISLLMYVFTKNSVDMYSGALFIQQAVGWNIYLSVALLLGMTVLSTIAGGLAAVIYTDTLQCFIMIGGGLLLSVLGIIQVGGFESLYYAYYRAISDEAKVVLTQTNLTALNNTCGLPETEAWTMLRGHNDREMPWPGFIFGQTVSSLWYWCADQMMVQRVLAAKSLSHAQLGCLFCCLLKLTPFFAMVLPGMIARVLYPEEVGCATAAECMRVCENEYSCSNIAYPKLVLGVMPAGLRGLMIAVMLSATMSDLSSTFNSASTLFTMDIWKRIRTQASTSELMIVGRLSVIGVVGVGIATIPLVMTSQGDQLYIYIQSITSDLSPPIAAVYLLAIFWKRNNEHGAFWGLVVGITIGLVRMILDFVYHVPSCAELDTRPMVVRLHYMYFALLLFLVTVTINVVISWLTEPLDEEYTYRTMFHTRHMRIFRTDDIVENVEPITDHEETEEKVMEDVFVDINIPTAVVKKPSIKKRVLSVVCGTEDDCPERQRTVNAQKQDLIDLTDITQINRDYYLLTAGAVLSCAVGVFVLMFLSIPWTDDHKPYYLKYVAEHREQFQ